MTTTREGVPVADASGGAGDGQHEPRGGEHARSPWVGIDPQVDPVRWARAAAPGARARPEQGHAAFDPARAGRPLLAARRQRRAWIPDRPAPRMLDSAADRQGAGAPSRLPPAAADREHAHRGDRGCPLLRGAQRRRRRPALGGRTPAGARDRRRTGLSPGSSVQRERGRDQCGGHRARARSPGSDLLGRALQPPAARLDLLGGADPRSGERRDPRGARPLRGAFAPAIRTACRSSPPSRGWSRTSWPRSWRDATSASRPSTWSGSPAASASAARWSPGRGGCSRPRPAAGSGAGPPLRQGAALDASQRGAVTRRADRRAGRGAAGSQPASSARRSAGPSSPSRRSAVGASAVVIGGERIELTPRHSEIVALLSLHPDGLSEPRARPRALRPRLQAGHGAGGDLPPSPRSSAPLLAGIPTGWTPRSAPTPEVSSTRVLGTSTASRARAAPAATHGLSDRDGGRRIAGKPSLQPPCNPPRDATFALAGVRFDRVRANASKEEPWRIV